TAGGTGGGTSVVITGSGFTGATAVRFGTLAATSFTVDSASQITAVSPAQASGKKDVLVTTPNGTSAKVIGDLFTYQVTKPVVTSISPTSGPKAGGTTVVVTGSGFTGATAVTFGTKVATFTVNSATQ